MAKKIVITKNTKLGKAWLHRSQDLVTDEELEEARKNKEKRTNQDAP